MVRKTWNSSALWRSAALVPLACAPWGVAPALAGPAEPFPALQEARQDSRVDVAQKLARIQALLQTKVKQGKGWADAQAPLDKELLEIERWLHGEAAKLGPKDRAATAKTIGPVLAEVRPPDWWKVVGKSIQLEAAGLLGELAPEGAAVLLPALKAIDPGKSSEQVWDICKSIGKQGTPECFAALVSAAGRKDGNFLRGAADGFSALPSPTAEQRKAAFEALFEGWGALNTQRASKGKKPIEEDQEEINVTLGVTFTLGRLSGAKCIARKDWEAWWKEHKKGEWK